MIKTVEKKKRSYSSTFLTILMSRNLPEASGLDTTMDTNTAKVKNNTILRNMVTVMWQLLESKIKFSKF